MQIYLTRYSMGYMDQFPAMGLMTFHVDLARIDIKNLSPILVQLILTSLPYFQCLFSPGLRNDKQILGHSQKLKKK